MNDWKRVFAGALLVALGLTSGCRSGVSKHGKTLALFLVPMYKQPDGYSSTYHRHLQLTAPVVQHSTPVIDDAKANPVSPSSKSQRSDKSEEVVYPTASVSAGGEQPTAGQQLNENLFSARRYDNQKTYRAGLIQPSSLDNSGE